MPDRLGQLVGRLADYPWWEVGVELAILWVLVFIGYRFVRGTRAAGALKGLILLLILSTLAVRIVDQLGLFSRLTVLYQYFIGLMALVLIVTFGPELRRALMRLGETSFFRQSNANLGPVIEAIVQSCELLSKNKFGAIIAIEQNVGLRETIEAGRALNADVSSHLLNTIFWPNSPLHDMGVVIRGDKIIAAGVQFPLADPADMPAQHLGTRHRAAVGLARQSDALIVVVSEETGAISLAEGREFRRWLTPESLRRQLTERLGQAAAADGREGDAPGAAPEGDDDPEADPVVAEPAAPPAKKDKKKRRAASARAGKPGAQAPGVEGVAGGS